MTVPTVRLRRSGMSISKLGLGLSRLHYLSDRDGQALIESAIDLGVTHFDAARLYGDGLAERVLGRAVGKGRDRVTVATKFGLHGSYLMERLGVAAYPLRVARAVARRAGIGGRHALHFSTTQFERSLTRSIAALGVDYIDIMFLHEPPPELADSTDDLLAALDRAKRDGRIRTIGVSAGGKALAAFASRFGCAIDVLQAPEGDWQPSLVPDITFGALAGTPQRYGSAGLAPAAVEARLRTAFARRPHGAILASTTRQDHLRALARIAGEPSA